MPDEYGTYGPEHILEIADAFMEKENIVFAYSPNRIDCYIISLNRDFEVLGTMPFGGNPRHRIWVSVYGRGAHHLSTGDRFHGYIQDKLGVDELCAKSIGQILGALHE